MGVVDPGKKFYRIGEAARVLGVTAKQLRALADRNEVPTVWRGYQRLFPVNSTEAYARRSRGETQDADALALGMIGEGRTNEEIVMALRIPLERVERLRAPADRLAKTRAAATREELAEDARALEALGRTWGEGARADAQRVAEHVQRLFPPPKMRA